MGMDGTAEWHDDSAEGIDVLADGTTRSPMRPVRGWMERCDCRWIDAIRVGIISNPRGTDAIRSGRNSDPSINAATAALTHRGEGEASTPRAAIVEHGIHDASASCVVKTKQTLKVVASWPRKYGGKVTAIRVCFPVFAANHLDRLTT